MATPWFYDESLTAATSVGSVVALSADEARHATGARRLRPGDSVVLCNGHGVIAPSVIADVERKKVLIEARSVESHPLETPRLHLFSALPKGDRVATLLGMATQLGMASFTPLLCARSVVQVDEPSSRWQRIVREASKQAQRPWFPELRPSWTLAAGGEPPSITRTSDEPSNAATPRRFVCDARGAAPPVLATTDVDVELFVGPEGGFSDDELQALAEFGAESIALARHILRTETAAVSAVAAFAKQRL